MRGFALLCILFAVHAQADGAMCHNDAACAPYEICTTSVGECGPGSGNADVCSGTCQVGRRFRFVPYAGGGVGATDSVTTGLAFAGLEVVPPILWGRLSLSAEYLGGAWRVGAASPWPLLDGFLLSPRIDALLRPNGNNTATGALRLDYFPWMPFSSCTPAHYFSIALEGGALFDALSYPYAAMSLRIWL